MKSLRAFLLGLLLHFAFCILHCSASDQVTATLTFTNGTSNGLTITITTGSASQRTWTNSVITPSIQILTNNTASGSASNLEAQLELYPAPGSFSRQTTPTNIVITANCGVPLTVASSGTYLSVSYATQACTAMWTVRVPPSGESIGQRTNVSSALSSWIEDSSNTNSINQNSFAVSELVGLTNSQAVSGSKRFTGSNYITGGSWSNPVLTNGLNYGSAFSSVGSAAISEQFGSSASASSVGAVALGNSAVASASYAVALGQGTAASADSSVALGAGAAASGTNSLAIGGSTIAIGNNSLAIGSITATSGTNAVAIGFGAQAGNNATAIGVGAAAANDNSTAVGDGATTTADNQIMLGATGISTVVQNNLTVQSNLTVGLAAQIGTINGGMGSTTNGTLYNPTVQGGTLQQFTAKWTNNFPANSDIAFARLANTGLANGNNAGVIIGTNVVMEVSGPSGAFSINGLTASPNRDGKIIWIINQTGQTMTIANESGVDATAGNRIRTGYGADITVTNNPGCVQLFYSGAASRWVITSKSP